MYFLLVRRRVRGVAIPNGHLTNIKPLRADVHIEYGHSAVLGRQCLGAWVFNPTPGPDVIPRLHDARVTGSRGGAGPNDGYPSSSGLAG